MGDLLFKTNCTIYFKRFEYETLQNFSTFATTQYFHINSTTLLVPDSWTKNVKWLIIKCFSAELR